MGIYATRSLLWGGKQQRLLELYDLASPLGIDDFNTHQLPISFLDMDLARAADQMVEPLKSHFDQIVLWIIDKTDERYPVGLHPTAELQRSHIDFHLGARESLRQMVEKRTPLWLFEILDGHHSLHAQAVFAQAVLAGDPCPPQNNR